MEHIPKDILRLLILEGLNAKAFHTFSLVNRLFSELCLDERIQSVLRVKFLVSKEIVKVECKVIEKYLPNGMKEGLEEWWNENGRLIIRCSRKNGMMMGDFIPRCSGRTT